MTIKELNDTIAHYQQMVDDLGSDQVGGAIYESFKPLFDANPEVIDFSWLQYTPHFNDGDPCEFSVQSYENENWFISLDGYEGKIECCDLKQPQKDNYSKFIDVVLNGGWCFPVLERLGEGEITVSRDGTVICEYYDHE